MSAATTLTSLQQRALRRFARETDLSAEFVLSGGTALAAFHLHHRRSDDLDFFSRQPVDSLRVRRFIDTLRDELDATDVEPIRLYDRHLFILTVAGESLKVEFTQYPYAALESPVSEDGVLIESLRDIAADKLAALLDRFEPKDYYDLYALFTGGHTILTRLRADAQIKFGIRVDPIQLGAAFARSANLPILPYLVTPIEKTDVQKFFDDLARGLKFEVVE